jgi:hypothetical protein
MIRTWLRILAVTFILAVPQVAFAQQLKLPDCVTTKDSRKAGVCSVDDIVGTGAAFANLVTELSAGLFFGVFIYGGAMYLLSFGDKSRVDKGKKAIVGAAIGMFIVLAAWTITSYIAKSLLGKI